VQRLESLKAQAGEHFMDYVLIVRTRTGVKCTSSDSCFALGAMQRCADIYINAPDE